jgi:hypothetical protein
MHGTWKTTGGGGPDLSGLIGPAVMLGVAVGAAMVIVEFALVIAIALSAVLVLGGALLAWWLLKGRPAGEAKAEAARLERAHAYELEQARRDALAHQRALELAAAGATVIQPVIQNVIDPAALLAAAFAPPPAPYRAEVIRGAVER